MCLRVAGPCAYKCDKTPKFNVYLALWTKRRDSFTRSCERLENLAMSKALQSLSGQRLATCERVKTGRGWVGGGGLQLLKIFTFSFNTFLAKFCAAGERKEGD